ncbi:MAG: C1 family peptidase, partial [Myxococcota bacterium]
RQAVHHAVGLKQATLHLGSLAVDWRNWLSHTRSRRSWVVGATDDADICVKSTVVSGRHARLTLDGPGRWWIEDLASRNGLTVDGRKVDRAPLTPESRVGLGSHEVAAKWLIRHVQADTAVAPPHADVRVPAAAVADRRADPDENEDNVRALALDDAESTLDADDSDEPETPPAPRPATLRPSRPTPSSSGGGGWAWVLLLFLAAGGGWWWTQHGRSGGSRPPAPTPGPAPSPTPGPAPDRVAWEPAWSYARALPAPADARSEAQTAQSSFGATPKGTDGVAMPPEQADFLVETAYLRKQLDPSALTGVPAESLKGTKASTPETYAVSAGSFPADYLVPNLDALPIRDQAQRGTCAAFTGIGAIEHATLMQRPDLSGINLSEERFYWIAKPECRDNGCSMGNEGSSYARAYDLSRQAGAPDIPSESECSYNPNPGPTDTHVPQPASCGKGVVKVASWKSVDSLQQVLQVLVNEKRPVAVGTTLSDRFMDPPSDGIISVAGDSMNRPNMHSAGHAYLLVGYKRLSNLPEEGNLCFVVRNSWGRSWGRGGYACVTQGWLQAHDLNFDGAVVTQVAFTAAPPPPAPPQPPPAPDAQSLKVRSPKGQWVEGAWRGGTGDGQFQLGLAAGGFSRPLSLSRAEQRLLWQGTVVGEVGGAGQALLCSGRYTRTCSLEIRGANRELRVSLRAGQPSHRSLGASAQPTQDATPWLTLLQLPDGRSLQAQVVLDRQVARLRLVGDDNSGLALEVSVQGTDIVVNGQTVGSLDPSRLGLCTGAWQDKCGWVIGSDGLDLIPW